MRYDMLGLSLFPCVCQNELLVHFLSVLGRILAKLFVVCVFVPRVGEKRYLRYSHSVDETQGLVLSLALLQCFQLDDSGVSGFVPKQMKAVVCRVKIRIIRNPGLPPAQSWSLVAGFLYQIHEIIWKKPWSSLLASNTFRNTVKNCDDHTDDCAAHGALRDDNLGW
jgi:hypothetical protein